MNAARASTASVADEAECLEWLWRRRFSTDGVHAACGRCGAEQPFQRIGRTWRCQVCGTAIDATAGTIFARSSVPLLTWFRAVALLRAEPEIGISELGRRLGLAYTTTWRMHQRLVSLDTDALEWNVPAPEGEPAAAAADASPVGDGRRQPTPAIDSEARMERILDAAQRAIVKRGLGGMRIADVAQEAGVSPATILYSFPTKEALLIASLERLYERSEAAMHERFASNSSAAAERLVALAVFTIGVGVSLDEHRLELEFLQRAAREPRLRRRWQRNAAVWREMVIDAVALGAARGEFTIDRSAEDVADMMVVLWDGLNIRLLLEYRWLPPERALDLGLASAAELLRVPHERLTALAEAEIAGMRPDLR